MTTNVQFSGTLSANQTNKWFTHSWPVGWHVIWYVMPTSPKSGAPQLDLDVSVERSDASKCTYWLTVKNLTGQTVNFEARYAVLNN